MDNTEKEQINLLEKCNCKLDTDTQTITCATSDLDAFEKLTRSKPKNITFELKED